MMTGASQVEVHIAAYCQNAHFLKQKKKKTFQK